MSPFRAFQVQLWPPWLQAAKTNGHVEHCRFRDEATGTSCASSSTRPASPPSAAMKRLPKPCFSPASSSPRGSRSPTMSGSGIPANENWLIVVRFFAWWKSVNSCQLDLVEEATFICCWWAHMFHIFWFNLALTCDGQAELFFVSQTYGHRTCEFTAVKDKWLFASTSSPFSSTSSLCLNL